MVKPIEKGDGVTATHAAREEGGIPKGSPHATGAIWMEEGGRRAGEQRCPHLSTMTPAIKKRRNLNSVPVHGGPRVAWFFPQMGSIILHGFFHIIISFPSVRW